MSNLSNAAGSSVPACSDAYSSSGSAGKGSSWCADACYAVALSRDFWGDWIGLDWFDLI